MNRPPRPFGNTPKIRWQQAIWDAMDELGPRIGPGVYTQDTIRATLRRLMRGRNNPVQVEPEPDFYRFGFGVNRWGPYASFTAVVGTAVSDPDTLSSPEINAPELQQYFTYNGSPVYYPGVLFPAGLPLPGTFRFTSPYRRASCRISVITGGFGPDHWTAPRPDVLPPGGTVDFSAPSPTENCTWIARKI